MQESFQDAKQIKVDDISKVKNLLPDSTESTKQNKFLAILLSILLLISCSIAVFFAYQTQKLDNELKILETMVDSTPIPTDEPVKVEKMTENWKAYSGKLFTFRYPEEMFFERQDVQDLNDPNNVGDMVQLTGKSFSIRVASNFNGGWGGNPCLVTEDKTVSGQKAQVLYFYKTVPGSETCSNDQYSEILALVGSDSHTHPYPIVIELRESTNVSGVDLVLFNQILSSFKLVD